MPEGKKGNRRRAKTVAAITIDAVSPEGRAFLIELKIGAPFQCKTGEWACPVTVNGLANRPQEAHGEDSYQALCLAISFAQNLLQDFRKKGGKLLMGSADFPLEAYSVRRRSISAAYKSF
jgi:hypothetical protein